MIGFWRRVKVCLLGLVVAAATWGGALAWHQAIVQAAPLETEQVMGKILSIERKGTAAKIVVDRYDGGGTVDLNVTRAMKFHSVSKGDTRFFRPGVWVITTANLQGNDLYADSFEVYVKTRLSPEFVKVPKTNEVQICGSVVSMDQFAVVLSIGPAGNRRIVLDAKALDQIKVYVPNADYVEGGEEVELEGVMRGKKFSPSKVTVKLAKPLSIEQVFSKKRIEHPGKGDVASKGADGDAPAKGAEGKAKPAPRGKKNAGQNPANPDPFGVLGNDTGKPKKGNKK